MTVAQDGCIFIQGGMSVELTDDGVEVWVTSPSAMGPPYKNTAHQLLTPDDMLELAQDLTRWAQILISKRSR